jgi:hypothetical protein
LIALDQCGCIADGSHVASFLVDEQHHGDWQANARAEELVGRALAAPVMRHPRGAPYRAS